MQDMHGVDSNYLKLFQLAQLTIEYLLVSCLPGLSPMPLRAVLFKMLL